MSTGIALIGLVIGLLTFIFSRRRDRAFKNDVHRLPSPKSPHWFWGHEKEANHDRPYPEAWNEWTETLGPVYKIKGAAFYGDILVPCDPDVISHIFTRNTYRYSKSPVFRPLIERLLGRSLVWAEGDLHRQMSRALAGHFTMNKIKEMEAPVIESAQRLVKRLREHVVARRAGNDKSGYLMNILGWPSRATLDVIGRVGFDYDFKCGDSPEAKELGALWENQSQMAVTFAGFMAPIVIRAFPFIARLPVQAIEAQAATKKFIYKLATSLAREELDNVKVGIIPQAKTNLLSSMVRASVKPGETVDINTFLDHIVTFVMVGHETSAGVVSYTLNELARNQDIQNKLRSELAAAGFSEDSERDPTFDELMDPKLFPYLDAVTKESIRMFPIAASTERVALEDDIIPLKQPIFSNDGRTLLNSIRIQKGQMVVISWLALNSNARMWGPDGIVYRPERWLPDLAIPDVPPVVPVGANNGWQHLSSFAEGPHMCIGYRLALFEVKAILVALLRELRFEAPPPMPIGDTGKTTDVKIYKTFSQLMHPRVQNGDQIGMEGLQLPMKVGLVRDLE